jgi:hypothetical protein
MKSSRRSPRKHSRKSVKRRSSRKGSRKSPRKGSRRSVKRRSYRKSYKKDGRRKISPYMEKKIKSEIDKVIKTKSLSKKQKLNKIIKLNDKYYP